MLIERVKNGKKIKEKDYQRNPFEKIIVRIVKLINITFFFNVWKHRSILIICFFDKKMRLRIDLVF